MKNKNATIYLTAVAAALLVVIIAAHAFLVSSGSAQEEEPQAAPCPKPYIKTISPRAVVPLQEVKIRGNRFGNEPGTVTFAFGVNGKIVSWTNKRIFVAVPEGAETGLVTVTSQCGGTSNEHYVEIRQTEEEY